MIHVEHVLLETGERGCPALIMHVENVPLPRDLPRSHGAAFCQQLLALDAVEDVALDPDGCQFAITLDATPLTLETILREASAKGASRGPGHQQDTNLTHSEHVPSELFFG